MLSDKLVKITDKRKKRRGRGGGSGKGFHTTGTGVKGQGSRAGYNKRWWFEGGQNPLVHSLPQARGFKRASQKTVIGINLFQLSKINEAIISEKNLRKAFGIVDGSRVKILAKGNIAKKIEVVGVEVSASAVRKIEKAGGKVLKGDEKIENRDMKAAEGEKSAKSVTEGKVKKATKAPTVALKNKETGDKR